MKDFGNPGSGYVSIFTDPDRAMNKQKIKKNLDFYILETSKTFLYLSNLVF